MIKASGFKVVICGTSCDNVSDLLQVIKHIEYTGKFFKDYRVIIFENDSSDGSKDILSNWQQSNDRVKILSKDFGNNKRPNIAFLAKARNFYLEELENNSQYNDFEMVVIVDLDMRYGWDIRGVLHSFSHIEERDAVCSNGIFSSQRNRGEHLRIS